MKRGKVELLEEEVPMRRHGLVAKEKSARRKRAAKNSYKRRDMRAHQYETK